MTYDIFSNHIDIFVDYIPDDILELSNINSRCYDIVRENHKKLLDYQVEYRRFIALLDDIRECCVDYNICKEFPILYSEKKDYMLEQLRAIYNEERKRYSPGRDSRALKTCIIFLIQLGDNIKKYLRIYDTIDYTVSPRALHSNYTMKNIISRSVMRRLYKLEEHKEFLDRYISMAYYRYKTCAVDKSICSYTQEDFNEYLKEFIN